jgi:hypothetical protein
MNAELIFLFTTLLAACVVAIIGLIDTDETPTPDRSKYYDE